MKFIERILKLMSKTKDELLAEIASFHSAASVADDVSKQVTDAVSAHIDELHTATEAEIAALTTKVSDQQDVIQAIADKLAASDVAGATQLAVTAAPSDPKTSAEVGAAESAPVETAAPAVVAGTDTGSAS